MGLISAVQESAVVHWHQTDMPGRADDVCSCG